MNIEKVSVNCSLSQTSFEHVIARIAEITGEGVGAVTLLTCPWEMFVAARLNKHYDELRRTSQYLNGGFIPPHIDVYAHYSAKRGWWAVIASDVMVWSPGA